MWKRLLLVTAVSAAMSSMAIAAPLTVGFSQVGSESGWRAAETSVAKEEAAKRGITLKIADGQQKQENQIKAVRSFIAQGVDAIFIAPVVATGWEPVLKEAKEAKIPVFLLDRSIDVKDKDLYMTTVTANNVLEGQLIGDWLVKTVDGKPCNVVELQGTVGASVAIDRKKGFADAIAKASNIKIIRSQSGDFTRSKGKEVMESFIKAENNGKNICMVFAHNDDMAIGAIQAIKEAGLKPGKDILTGSIDGVPDIYKAMIAGEANASVELTPNMAGPAFDALEKYKKRRHPAGEADHYQIDAVPAGYGERRVREEEKYGLLSGEPLIPSLPPVGEGKKQRSRNPREAKRDPG